MKRAIPKLLTVIGVMMVWFVLSETIFQDKNKYPSPLAILQSYRYLAVEQDVLLSDLIATTLRSLLGLLFAVLFAIPLGLATGISRVLDDTLAVIFNLLRPVTPVAMVPFFIMWFGINEMSKIALVSWGAFFPIWVATHVATQNTEKALVYAAYSLGFSRIRIVFEVYLLSALPGVLGGARIGAAVSVILVFVAETMGASSGLGHRLLLWHQQLRVDHMAACLLTLGFLGLLYDAVIQIVSRLAFPWLIGFRTQ